MGGHIADYAIEHRQSFVKDQLAAFECPAADMGSALIHEKADLCGLVECPRPCSPGPRGRTKAPSNTTVFGRKWKPSASPPQPGCLLQTKHLKNSYSAEAANYDKKI